MAHDPKLVEAVAKRAHAKIVEIAELHYAHKIEAWEDLPEQKRQHLCEIQEEALHEIEASGHWIAPWEASSEMIDEHWPETNQRKWSYMRDAYLAERRGDAG